MFGPPDEGHQMQQRGSELQFKLHKDTQLSSEQFSDTLSWKKPFGMVEMPLHPPSLPSSGSLYLQAQVLGHDYHPFLANTSLGQVFSGIAFETKG